MAGRPKYFWDDGGGIDMTPYTPTLSFVTPGDQNMGITFESGNYVQDRNGVVHFEFNIQFSPIFTTALGLLSIGLPPIVPSLAVAFTGQVRACNATWPALAQTLQLQLSQTDVRVVGLGSGVANQGFGVGQFTSGGSWQVAGNAWYF